MKIQYNPINLREEILREHSKEQCLRIAHYIGEDKQRFDELVYLFINDEYRVCQRAAWVVSTVADIISRPHPTAHTTHVKKFEK